MNEYYFPFGQKLKKVQQVDRTPKKAFLLGVYASAVHARWVDKEGKQKVAALAVASEPNIFWNGEGAEKIISDITIPEELGKLTVPTNKKLNGPSGRALDKSYLAPLRLNRNDIWLCDLLPESRVNFKQKVALEKHYTQELIEKYNLPEPTILPFSKTELKKNLTRHEEILNELILSKAETLILLGDLPIQYFLNYFVEEFSKLSDFVLKDDDYGKPHEIKIKSKTYSVIPLCHPRQAERLGSSSTRWGTLHDEWIKNI